MAGHDVGVDVDRIDRIGDGDDVVGGEDVQDVAAVALGAVGDEDLVGGDVAAAARKSCLRDGLAQELVALLGAVALEGFAAGHFVQRPCACASMTAGGSGSVTSPMPMRMICASGCAAAKAFTRAIDLGKEVAGLELEIIVVDADHGRGGDNGEWGKSKGFHMGF